MKAPLIIAAAAAFATFAYAEESSPAKAITDVKASDAATRFSPSSGQVSAVQDPAGVAVTIEPGKDGYPGVTFTPEGGPLDLSAFGHVEARVVNTGSTPLGLALRVDGKGNWKDNPWNTESATIKPGESRNVKVIFGHSYGYKEAYKLNPAEVVRVLLFANKKNATQSFRIEAIEAAGPAGEKPPIDPKTVRVVPKDGVILGKGVAFDAAKQVDAKDGAAVAPEGTGIKIDFPNGKPSQSVSLKPAMGKWDLREALQVRVKMKNLGKSPVTPKLYVGSGGGSTSAVTETIAPGQEKELTASFIPAVPWEGIKGLNKTSYEGTPKTGTKFTSDAAGPVVISRGAESGDQSLLVTSIIADVPPAPAMPDWLGKRPPVDGDWVQTFSEEFDGNAVDATKWNIYTENFWDKRSHFSKDNVIIANGIATLRYEKKKGWQNDDAEGPKKKQTDYATGFLDTYGKWVQRYGYFEARMKLPKAPGLWPGFWLMPDRGVAEGPQWKRADTGRGAMEFDIMEFLSRWGPYRYNIAMHWDGYDKGHKSTGTTTNYFQPDKDGYITAGLLWLPGQAIYYANGREVARLETDRISNVESDIMFTYVTGGWDNNAIDDTAFPEDFLIDYVRVWQRKDLASEVDGPKSAPAPTPAASPAAPAAASN